MANEAIPTVTQSNLGDPNVRLTEHKKSLITMIILGITVILFIIGIIFKTPAEQVIFYIVNLGIAYVTGQSGVDMAHKFAVSKIGAKPDAPPQIDIKKVDITQKDDKCEDTKIKERYENK